MKAVIFLSSPATWRGDALAAVDVGRGALQQVLARRGAYLVVGEGVYLRHGGGLGSVMVRCARRVSVGVRCSGLSSCSSRLLVLELAGVLLLLRATVEL